MPIDKRWEQDSRNLPTEKKYLHEEIMPKAHPIETQYILKPIKLNGKEFKYVHAKIL